MDVILALDPARKTGVAIGALGQRPHLTTINFARELDGPEDVFARALRWIEGVIEAGIEGERPTLLAIEAPVPPSQKAGFTNFDTTLIALGLSAIFRGSARSRSIPIKLVPISSWRKYVLGRGNLKGKDAKAAMVRLVRGLGWGEVDHNAAEAGGIFLWASGQINPHLGPPLFVGAPA